MQQGALLILGALMAVKQGSRLSLFCLVSVASELGGGGLAILNKLVLIKVNGLSYKATAKHRSIFSPNPE